MILPNKYISLSESFIGLSALLLDIIGNKDMSIDILWKKFKNKYIDTNELKPCPTYQKFVYVLDFMYLTNMITYNSKGEIRNENLKS